MKYLAMIFSLAMSVSLQAAPHDAEIQDVIAKNLADLPGKEGRIIVVTYPPGGVDPVHTHDAHGFIYVLEGTIVMQVKGSPPVTLKPGQSFYEGPDDVHIVGRNASDTQPAKFVVFLVKKQGAPILTPVQ